MTSNTFGGVTPELKALCDYKFPRVNSPNCHRFAPRPGRKSNPIPTPEQYGPDEGAEEWELEGAEDEGEYYCDRDPFFENLQKRPSKRHVFANVWERSLDPRNKGGCNKDATETWTIDWRKWPPNVARISQGVKIPVEILSNPSLRVLEATPLNSGTSEFYQGLKGLLNPCQTSAFSVHPPALLFLNSRIGQFYSVKLRLKNTDTVPRRVMFVPPKNQDFFISWSNNQRLPIVPGLSVPILVEFRPKTNLSHNELLFITVEGCGGLTVPLIACAEAPPILEFEEWDCACSVSNVARMNVFEIRNVGNEGRFWILTEKEFRYQYIAYPKRRLEPEPDPNNNAPTPEGQRNSQRGGSGSQLTRLSVGLGLGGQSVISVIAGPFEINTPCFKLLRNQRIKIEVKFHPRKPGLHYEKLAVLCDSGEVRWIGVKGMGIDFYSNTLLDLKVPGGYWMAPPIDLPFDEKCHYAIDLGDLLPGTEASANFRIENKSCIQMYYFWSVRPLKTGLVPASTTTTEGGHGRTCFSIFPEGTLEPSDGTYDQDSFSLDSAHSQRRKSQGKEVVDLRVSPAQGTLSQKQLVEFSVSASCPQQIGYYACVMSLFIEQLGDVSIPAVRKYLKELEASGMNEVPIHEDFLKEVILSQGGGTGRNRKKHHNGIFELDDEGEDVAFILHPKRKHHDECKDPEYLESLRRKLSGDSVALEEEEDEANGWDGEGRGRMSRGAGGDGGAWGHRGSRPPKPKSWARKAGVLEPIVEIEIWLRSIPLEITFSPPIVTGMGVVGSRMERDITVTNESQWEIEIDLKPVLERCGSVCCQPRRMTLQPLEQTSFTAIICLRAHGMISEPISGTVNVVGSTTLAPISLHCAVSSRGPYIRTLTPILHFGFVPINSEKMKTIAIENTGNRPARWEASVNAENLYDEAGRNLTPYNCNIVGMNLLRVWPTWGVLEPGEVMGVNVYLASEIPGDIVASITLSVQDVPDSIIIVPVLAVVQTPFLFLEETEIFLDKNSLEVNSVVDASLTLVNPTGSPIAFAFQPCLLGPGAGGLEVEFFPGTGFVPPRGTMDIIISISLPEDGSEYQGLKHVYAVCMVDGMKEPIILKVSGDRSEKGQHRLRDGEEEDDFCYPEGWSSAEEEKTPGHKEQDVEEDEEEEEEEEDEEGSKIDLNGDGIKKKGKQGSVKGSRKGKKGKKGKGKVSEDENDAKSQGAKSRKSKKRLKGKASKQSKSAEGQEGEGGQGKGTKGQKSKSPSRKQSKMKNAKQGKGDDGQNDDQQSRASQSQQGNFVQGQGKGGQGQIDQQRMDPKGVGGKGAQSRTDQSIRGSVQGQSGQQGTGGQQRKSAEGQNSGQQGNKSVQNQGGQNSQNQSPRGKPSQIPMNQQGQGPLSQQTPRLSQAQSYTGRPSQTQGQQGTQNQYIPGQGSLQILAKPGTDKLGHERGKGADKSGQGNAQSGQTKDKTGQLNARSGQGNNNLNQIDNYLDHGKDKKNKKFFDEQIDRTNHP